MVKTKHIPEKTKEWLLKYADKKGFILNPDGEMLNTVIDGLTKNRNELGSQYCPCRIITGDKEEDKNIICPCVYHEEEINNNGSCHCGLFFKNNGNKHRKIPEEDADNVRSN